MNESDKAQVRGFLATQAAKVWLEECKTEYPRLNRTEVKDIAVYHSGLDYNEGWRNAIEHLTAKVRREDVPDFGVQPIDTTRD